MVHYLSNLRDIRFNLFEVLDRQHIFASGSYPDLDESLADMMLTELERLAVTVLAPTFADGVHADVQFDRATHSVTLPKAFKEAYLTYTAAEWWRLDVGSELGGTPIPPSLRWALAELVLGAHPAAYIYASGWMHAQVLHALGNHEQRQMAKFMTNRAWAATMVLTEADAGSSVGAGRTRAVPQDDGTWHIQGVKRFITSGDHDLSENIVHFVLARPVATPGAGGPGTKGLSLFVVPKYRFNLQTGDLGDRNGVFVTHVEHKMGLRISATCELTFGETQPAVGVLLGDVHDGIAQMFTIVEHARMLVGTKAMATLSSGYLNALAYAKSRVQGAALSRRGDRTAPEIPIIEHADVRRSLLTQKAYAEGLRALILFAAAVQDDIAAAEEGADVASLEARNDLLLPVVKGFSSERAYSMLSESLQIFGGSGYLQDYPIEQYIRDAKIDTVYEGTTGIQGIDFFFRKIMRDKRQAVDELLDDVARYCAAPPPSDARPRVLLTEALDAVRETVDVLASWSAEAGRDARLFDLIGLNATRLLIMFGELLVGWLLSRQADVAAARLKSGRLTDEDAAFYRGKITTSAFFAETRLPLLSAERSIVANCSLEAMDMSVAGF